MPRLSSSFVVLFLVLAGRAASAQQLPGTNETVVAAELDGQRAANERTVIHYSVPAFVGGLVSTFMVPIALAEQGNPEISIAAAAVAGLWATSRVASRYETTIPASDRGRVQALGAEYEQAYLHAYADRLRERRRSVTRWGAWTGGISAVGLFVAALATDSS